MITCARLNVRKTEQLVVVPDIENVLILHSEERGLRGHHLQKLHPLLRPPSLPLHPFLCSPLFLVPLLFLALLFLLLVFFTLGQFDLDRLARGIYIPDRRAEGRERGLTGQKWAEF